MSPSRSAPSVACVVPFHNEEHYLSRLIDSLRAQRGADTPIVFVNNGSTDRSPTLVDNCDETRAGRWCRIDEARIGKFYALKAGVAYCLEHFGAQYVGCFDADAFHGSPDWIRTGLAIADTCGPDFGFTYSPFGYVGFEYLPVFHTAYRAYERVLHHLIEQVGWMLNGQGFIASATVLEHYFTNAQALTSVDMPLALFALAAGRRTAFHPVPIWSSSRRITVNPQNFEAWCFYDERYYAQRDINSAHKLNLHRRTSIADLHPDQVDRFFTRRALKLVCRDLIPLAIFDRRGDMLERVGAAFGSAVAASIRRAFQPLATDVGVFLTQQHLELVSLIEGHAAGNSLAELLAAMMREQHSRLLAGDTAGAKATSCG